MSRASATSAPQSLPAPATTANEVLNLKERAVRGRKILFWIDVSELEEYYPSFPILRQQRRPGKKILGFPLTIIQSLLKYVCRRNKSSDDNIYIQYSKIFRLKCGARRLTRAICKAWPDLDTPCGAEAVPVVVGAISDVAHDAPDVLRDLAIAHLDIEIFIRSEKSHFSFPRFLFLISFRPANA